MTSLLQLAWGGLYIGSRYLILGASFSLLYRSCRFVDFLFGTAYIVAPFVALAAYQRGASQVVSLGCGVAAPLLLAPLTAWLSIYTLGRDGQGGNRAFIASLGVAMMAESLLAWSFGDSVQAFVVGRLREPIDFHGLIVTRAQLSTIGVTVVVLCIIQIILRFSVLGLKLRILQESETGVVDLGLSPLRIRFASLILAYGIAGCAGILLGIDADIEPRMGFEGLMVGVFIALLAPATNSLTVGVWAFLVAAVEQCANYYLGGSWKNLVTFAAILAVLAWRSSRGRRLEILGERLRLST